MKNGGGEHLEPWYREGLRFTCTQCGNCCTGEPGYVWVNAEEITALATRVGVSNEEFLSLYTRKVGTRRTLKEKENGDCVFFDRALGCTVYESRPRQCGTWPFWDSNLKNPESWQETCRICPGSGEGKLYTVDEITLLRKVIPL